MNLLTETKHFAVWFARLNKVCLTTRPFWTLIVIGATVVSNVAKLLAFLLPLKVVLLAGSEGVPRYFAFFIDAADKDAWIMGLAAGAIISYIAHLSLDALIQRMALTGGNSVAQMANRLALVGNQERTAQKYYSRITSLSADGVFLVLTLGLVTFIMPGMMANLGVVAIVFLLMTMSWLATGSERAPSWIEGNTKLYSNIVTSALFLAAFLLIVYPYIMGNGPNILLSLVAIVLLKRCAKALHSIITGSIGLFAERTAIDPLMFRGEKVVTQEQPVKTALRDLFQKSQRQALVRQYLPEAYRDYDLDVRWEDQRISGVNTFKIKATAPKGGGERILRLYLCNSRNKYLLEREDHLFQSVNRRYLLAPELLVNFEFEDFSCTMVDYGTGRSLNLAQWTKESLNVLQQHWAIDPPKRLLKDYKLSHSLMWRRIDEAFIERVRIAVENDQEGRALNAFLSDLGNTKAKLAAMPLYIANGEMRGPNAVRATKGSQQIMMLFWGRWSIEPMGYYLPAKLSSEDLDKALTLALHERDVGGLDSNTVVWVNTLAEMEKSINKHNYRAALKAILELSRSNFNEHRNTGVKV